MSAVLRLKTPRGFDIRTAVCGHGWYDLPPFSFDAGNGMLVFVFRNPKGKPIEGVASMSRASLEVSCKGSEADLEMASKVVRHMLRLDEDLDQFYRLVESEDGLKWVLKKGAGRLLRSQTVFEDLVKTICTTNCSWSLTKSMVGKLVSELGDETRSGRKAFPTAEVIADRKEKFFRDIIRAGYRAPYFPALAKDVVAGRIDPESWLDPSIPIVELKKEIKSVKGVGDYAAENLLKLLGRYDGLALDSWLRAGFARKHNNGRKCADSKIEKHYARFGKWKGLAIWCDMTEEWF